MLKGLKIAQEDNDVPPSAKPRPVTAFPFLKDGLRADPSDNDLLAAIAEGDRRAFTVLMRRHLSSMVMLAQRIVFDAEQAREIAQEAFLRVWRHAAEWDPNGSATFATWLRRVTVNFAISQRRRRREQVPVDAIAELPDTGPDAFDAIADHHKRRMLGNALQQLPERQRAALALFYYDDISQIDAAGVMGLSPKAFDSLLVRARRNVKKYLSGAGILRKGDLS